MEGFTGLDYPTRVPEAFEALSRWRRDGSLVHKEDVAYGLENAPKALLRLFSGENFGKQLVKGESGRCSGIGAQLILYPDSNQGSQ